MYVKHSTSKLYKVKLDRTVKLLLKDSVWEMNILVTGLNSVGKADHS